jgi:hypothetical protein
VFLIGFCGSAGPRWGDLYRRQFSDQRLAELLPESK